MRKRGRRALERVERWECERFEPNLSVLGDDEQDAVPGFQAKMTEDFFGDDELSRLVDGCDRFCHRGSPATGEMVCASNGTSRSPASCAARPLSFPTLSGATPICPEGERFCGIPVWRNYRFEELLDRRVM